MNLLELFTPHCVMAMRKDLKALLSQSLLVMALYFFVIARCLWMALQSKDTYSRLLAGALALTFFIYIVVNGGMVAGFLPVVGVPMPLISYGGTSAVSLLAGFGLIMSAYSHRKYIGD